MQIPYFEVRSQRSISLARCENVPPLMVIAGPNGTGKSTLLNALRTLGPNYPPNTSERRNTIYIGPHRSIRPQQVQQRNLLGAELSFQAIMSGLGNPQIEGFSPLYEPRTGSVISREPWSIDDSGHLLKPALCQIEIERQEAVTARFDRDGEIVRDSLVDPWIPFRELTHRLLPHLIFHGINAASRDRVSVEWRTHATDTTVDFDNLSSGEKSIIQMFYPLIEQELRASVEHIKAGVPSQERPERCVLIDEPELHLHPNL